MPRDTDSPRFVQINPTPTLDALLVHINWTCCYGVILTYEGSEAEILATGLISPDDLPGEKKGCHRRIDDCHISRLQHGNIRLRVNADRLFKRTPQFKQFMGSLLSDSRL